MQVILQEKGNLPPVLLSCHSRCPTIPSWTEEETAHGDRLVLAPTPTKGLWCSGGRTEKSHRLPPWFLAMGGSSGARTANTAGKKRGKRKREKIKQEIVRAKGKMLGCYSLIRSPFLWWSHLLREGEMRSVVQTLKHEPPWFHYCYWQCWFYNVPVKLLNSHRAQTDWTPEQKKLLYNARISPAMLPLWRW